MNDALSRFERDLLAEVAASEDPAERSPAALAMSLDADLPLVLETVADLHDRGLLEREGFDTCRLTERGRDLAADAH
jgi:Mn-dependent DtxR family transcriptional regulator